MSSSQAASYERQSASQREAGIQLLEKLKVEKGMTVLDLGCGTGWLSKVISEQVGPKGKVVAVDPDEERLKIARKTYSANNIEFKNGDDKTFPPGPYDLVCCNIAIHWVKDKEQLLKSIYRNLKPGGRFGFTTCDGFLSMPDIGKKLFGELVGPDFLHTLHTKVIMYLSAEEYKTMASAAGFEVTSSMVEDVWPEWKNIDDYIDSMHGWFGGRFDPTTFDKDTLTKLKEEYGDGPVFHTEPIRRLDIILTQVIEQ